MIFCFDLDGTICQNKKGDQSYDELKPIDGMPEFLNSLHSQGHTIIISTARHMKTCNNNVGMVVARQGEILFKWLNDYNIPYDEIHFGKPLADYYIDDKAVKFTSTSELKKILDV